MRSARTGGPSPATLLAVAALIAVLGLASVRIGFAAFETRIALVSLLTGWLVAGCGLLAWYRAPSSRIGPMVILVSAAWYVGGFRWVAWPPLAELAAGLDIAYAAFMAHVLIAWPSGRVRRAPERVVVAIAYGVALLPVGRAELLVAACIVAGVVIRGRSEGRVQGWRILSAAGLAFAFVLAAHPFLPAWLGIAWLDSRPILQLGLVLGGLAAAVPLVRFEDRAARASDLVVDLGSSPSDDLLRELGELAGDRDLSLGYWVPGQGRYVDAFGRPLELPSAGSSRAATRIEATGRDLVAVVVHRADVSLDPELRAAMERALAVAASNARLQAEAREQADALHASRQRLLVAGDEERATLERMLGEGIEPRLAALEASLGAPGALDDATARSLLEQLASVREELVGLVRGLGPPALDERGMPGALADLAARAPVPVELSVDAVAVPASTARTALFVANEALANMAKHADPRRAWIRLRRRADSLDLEVVDDGRGGADPARGTGLQGLRDRVEAHGGRLVVESRAGLGTRVLARLPLEEPRG
jgi:signal transduction histidine kinase